MQSIDSIWPKLVEDCVLANPGESRDGDSREILGRSFIVDPLRNILFNRTRSASLVYGAAEFLWYLSWLNNGDHIMAYAPSYSRFLNADGYADGAYGPRWRGQILRILFELTNPNTRRAVMGTWNEKDLGVETKDCPCTLSFQFFVRDRRLSMIATMRSNDLWLGTPYDVFCFTSLQRLIAEFLGLQLGWYVHQPGSLHIYERNIEKATLVPAGSSVNGPAIRYVEHPRGLTFMELVASATEVEYLVRHNPVSFNQLRDMLKERELERTMLGSYVALCWLNFADLLPTIHDLGLVMPGQLALVAEKQWKRKHSS
jgi:hypothetical protein